MAIWALPLSIDGASPPPSNCCASTWYSEFDRGHEISPCWSLPVLYPHAHIYSDASPKAVSERTSYSQIRLAFHSLPQVIPRRCTTNGFGPPSVFRQTSPCSWQAHLASGRIYPTNALLTLGFPKAPPRKGLAAQDIHTRRLILQ